MTKDQKLQMALPFLVIVVVIVWMPNFASQKTNTGKKEGNESLETVGDKIQKIRLLTKKDESINETDKTTWGRNPFQRPRKKENKLVVKKVPVKETIVEPEQVFETVNLDHVILNGIFWNDAHSTALINGKLLKIGDTVEDFKIIAINKEYVILDVKNQSIEIRIKR